MTASRLATWSVVLGLAGCSSMAPSTSLYSDLDESLVVARMGDSKKRPDWIDHAPVQRQGDHCLALGFVEVDEQLGVSRGLTAASLRASQRMLDVIQVRLEGILETSDQKGLPRDGLEAKTQEIVVRLQPTLASTTRPRGQYWEQTPESIRAFAQIEVPAAPLKNALTGLAQQMRQNGQLSGAHADAIQRNVDLVLDFDSEALTPLSDMAPAGQN